MMIKRVLTLLITALFSAGCLCACGSQNGTAVPDDGKLKIVATIFPEYDWVMNVLGENAEDADVTLLLANGVDLHSFQPTAEDILKISTCDLFIYVGGESDAWVDMALQEATNKEMVVVNLLDVLGDSVKEEEVIEGMQAEEEEHEEEADAEEEPEYDEHVWLSLRNASVLVQGITEALQKADPAHEEDYRNNAAAYVAKLGSLDRDYQTVVDAAPLHTLLFGDRFPFRYLTDDYGLDYYAAFVGCSAETEASFETITFLAHKVDELGLPAVMTIEGDNHRIAETIVENTQSKDAKILTMDSMQSTTAKDIADGATYLSIMEKNLDVMKEALQ